jgi:hypothetical protein
MTHSEQINEIAAALAKAQGQIEGAKKDSTNPHFKSSYADLSSVWDACRKALTTNGLSVVQGAESEDGRVGITTVLLHVSGQWMKSTLFMRPAKDDPQGVGSCLTYARRYALSAMVGVAPEDDDANAASAKPTSSAVVAMPPSSYADWLADLEAVADEGTEALQKAWKASDTALRDHLTKTNGKRWDAIKVKAEKVKA